MITALPRSEPFFGLLELDADGRVLYYKPERDGSSTDPMPNIIGENFFTDVAPGANIKELKERLTNFRRSHASALSFNFTFSFEHGTIPARVLLARIYDRSELGSTESTLVHFRKA